MLLLLMLPFIFSITMANKTEYMKILNGKPTTINKYPYQVGLFYRDFLMCGGSILSEKVVLTAAHCLTDGITLTVEAGMTYIMSNVPKQIVKIDKTLIHPRYDTSNDDYDVGIIILRQSLVLSDKVAPIRLPNRPVRNGEIAVATGWGHTKENGATSKVLQAVELPIISSDVCSLLFDGITNRLICAGYVTGGYDTCQGDSGGPLAIKNELVGITSWGYGCGNPGYPGVYTYLYMLKDWIHDTLKTFNLELNE